MVVMDGDVCKATPGCDGVIEDEYCNVGGRIGARQCGDAMAALDPEPETDTAGPVHAASNGRGNAASTATTATARPVGTTSPPGRTHPDPLPPEAAPPGEETQRQM